MTALQELASRLRAHGGLLAAATVDPPADAEFHPDLVVEAIREGELAHYGQARVLRTEDRDLALLAGDWLYARGLAELARAGELEAVSRLAKVIALCAKAHAEGRPEDAEVAWRLETGSSD